jgi:tubulin polyglutamylase TTLL6/13
MKFDFRLYVLVNGVNPLRIYLSKEGLARLSVRPYEDLCDENLEDMTMHLTNYAINKNSTRFCPNRTAIIDSVGHKRSLRAALKGLRKVDKRDTDKLMAEIKDIIVKTVIAGQPFLDQAFRQV